MSNNTVRIAEINGLLYGALAGLLAAAVATGPHLRVWPVWQIAATFVLCAVLASCVGYCAVMLSYSSLIASPLEDYLDDDDGLSGFGDGSGDDD